MPQTPSNEPAAASIAAAPVGRQACAGEYLLLTVLTLALLLPFLNKAFHIDDPLFIWTAKQIQAHPGDPYGFTVNWYDRVDPMFAVTQNPPLAGYYLAGAGALLGWSEPALHAAMLLPALGVVLGVYRLARRFCSRPLWAGLATLATPVFLVSSTTVMCDTLMLCFWLWAVVLWVEGLDRGLGLFAMLALPAAGVLVAAAAMTKYFGVSLIPLLLVYSLARRRHLQSLALLVPVAVLIAYQVWTRHLYGQGLLGRPVAYVTLFYQSSRLGLTLLDLMSFTGGCLLPALLLFPLLVSRQLRWLVGLIFLLVLLALIVLSPAQVRALNTQGRLNYPLAVQLAAFAVGGLMVLILAVRDLARYRDADAIFLGLWVLGTFAFAGFVNWSINGRSILPMAPAVGILLVRGWEAGGVRGSGGFRSALPTLRGWDWRWLAPVGLSAVLGFSAAWADQSVANASRSAAGYINQKYGRGKGQLWFEGHWGFQYYMQADRGLPLVHSGYDFHAGDFVAMPLNNTNLLKLPPDVALCELGVQKVTPWISVNNKLTGAGFYTDIWGSAPFVLGPNRPEQFKIYEVTRPMRGTQLEPLR